MAGQRTIKFAGPSFYLRDRKTAVQRSVNCYPMLVEGLGEDVELVMERSPGLVSVHDFGAAVRGVHHADGRLFVVAGSGLYEVAADDSVTLRGSILSSTGRVSMANGQNQLAIVDGVNLAVMSLTTNALAHVSSAAWRGSYLVDQIDGYFTFTAPGTEQFYISAIDDGTSLDALDFTSADTQPDDIVAHIVERREVFLMGSRSTEVWINSGSPDFPFARYQGTPIDVGVCGAYAVVRAAGSLVWVGQSRTGGPYVYTLNGYQPVRISDQAIEQVLERCTDLANVVCWAYQEAGSEFIAVNIPGAQTTWVWDASTKMWHERAETTSGDWSQFRVAHAAYFNNRHYVGGGNVLYRMSRDYHDYAGDMLRTERTWPHLVGGNLEPVTYRGLEVRCTTGDATAGNITLEVSNDGGAVFGSPLRRSLGTAGQRQRRVRWFPLGTCPAGGSRVFRLRCADPVPLTIQTAVVEA